MRDVPQPVARADAGEEDAEELAERDTDGCDGAGLDDEEEGPAVEESPQRPQRLAQVNILPAGPGHHGGELAVAERAGDGHGRRHQPGRDQQRRRSNRPAHVRRDDEDARPDHRAHHNRSRGEQPHPPHKMRCLLAVIPRRNPTLVVISQRSGGICFWIDWIGRIHFPLFYRRSSRKSRATCSTLSPSASSPEITATESAPASIALRAFTRVIPPIATSGLVVSARARRTPSNPTTGSVSALVVVANTGPMRSEEHTSEL